jgi:HEAT repeat protein
MSNSWIEQLQSDDAGVRCVALTQLQEELDGLTVDRIMPLLHDGDATVRRLTVGILEELGDVRAIPGLIEATVDRARDVADVARLALREFRTPEAALPLIQGLAHPNPTARAAAIFGLRDLRSLEAIPALIRAASDEDAYVRREAIIALAHLRRLETLPVLRQTLKDAEPEVRKIAVGAVNFFQESSTNSDLLDALFDEDWQVRRESAIALSRFPSGPTVAGLSGALDDTHWQVAKEALVSLGKLRAPATSRVVSLLSHGMTDVRMAAATALGESGDQATVGQLETLLKDPDTGVQKAARLALEKLKQPSSKN